MLKHFKSVPHKTENGSERQEVKPQRPRLYVVCVVYDVTIWLNSQYIQLTPARNFPSIQFRCGWNVAHRTKAHFIIYTNTRAFPGRHIKLDNTRIQISENVLCRAVAWRGVAQKRVRVDWIWRKPVFIISLFAAACRIQFLTTTCRIHDLDVHRNI